MWPQRETQNIKWFISHYDFRMGGVPPLSLHNRNGERRGGHTPKWKWNQITWTVVSISHYDFEMGCDPLLNHTWETIHTGFFKNKNDENDGKNGVLLSIFYRPDMGSLKSPCIKVIPPPTTTTRVTSKPAGLRPQVKRWAWGIHQKFKRNSSCSSIGWDFHVTTFLVGGKGEMKKFRALIAFVWKRIPSYFFCWPSSSSSPSSSVTSTSTSS